MNESLDAYREAVAGALSGGWTFGGLHESGRGRVVRTLLVAQDGRFRLESVAPVDRTVPTITDLTAAAVWDEREAADLAGIVFAGHEPLRPLLDHDPDLARWTVPVRGEGPYQVAVGPIHAGVIESGHFRFHLVGDRILLLDARLFYKHRGLERAAEGRSFEHALPYVERACAACSVSSPLAYVQACEAALGLRAAGELARARTVLAELERFWSHLNDVAAVCAGVGMAAGNMLFAELTDRARRLDERLTGHRFLRGAVAVAGSALDLDTEAVRNARNEIEAIASAAARASRELLFSGSFQDRLRDVGTVRSEDARRLGATGPAARAAGVPTDARAAARALAYDDFSPVLPARPTGDVRARLEQRLLELDQTRHLLLQLLDRPLRPAAAEPDARPAEVGVGRVESPRGATTCIVEHDRGRVSRLRLRTGSYANWPVVAFAASGEMLPDFPLINKSFELCYACVDR